MNFTKLMLLLGLIALSAVAVFADEVATQEEEKTDIDEEEEGPKHILTDLPPPAADLKVLSYVFPGYNAPRFQSGEFVDTVVGVQNTGEVAYKVAAVAGSLNSPYQFSYYIQNFTQVDYDTRLLPGEQKSIGYRFKPDALLEPDLEFQLALTVFYEEESTGEDAGERFSTTFFNSTVTTYEAPIEVDVEQFFTYVAGAGVAGLVLLIAMRSAAGSGKRRKRVETGTRSGADGNEWLSGVGSNKKSPSQQARRGKKA